MSVPLTLFTSATVFDGEQFLDGPFDIAVEDGKIAAVGRGLADSDRFATADIVDCSSSTVFPGFIDVHVHLMASRLGQLSALTRPFSAMFYDAVANAKATLAGGITTVRDAAGADLGLKQAIADGVIAGPRTTIAVSMMSQTGGHGDMLMASGVRPTLLNYAYPGRPSGIADGPDEVRHTTRALLQAGADHIKIAASGGVLSPTDDPRHPQFTLDEIRIIVDEAERQEAHVMAHAMASAGIMASLRAGVRSIEHGVYIDDECIEYMVAHDRYLVPTMIAPLEVLRLAESGTPVPKSTSDKAERVAELHRENVARAVHGGVRIAMGTDAGVGDHGHNLDELPLLADLGMSTQAVLASATSVAADLMSLDDIGRIAPGRTADLVVAGSTFGASSSLAGLSSQITGIWQSGRRVV